MASKEIVKVQGQLTCGKCHNLYTNPKTLSCHHSFCQQCIEGLPTIPTLFVACPTCHQHTQLPEHDGSAGFSVSPQVAELIQVYEKTKQLLHEEVTCSNCSNAIAAAYCKSCSTCLCKECIETHQKWSFFSGHSMLWFNESPTLEIGKAVGPRIEAALSIFEIKEKGESIKKEIWAFVQGIANNVYENLSKEVDEVVQRKVQLVRENRADESLPDFHFIKDSTVLLDDVHRFGNVISASDLRQCKVKDISTVRFVPEEKAIVFFLSIKLPHSSGALLIVPPSSLSLKIIPNNKAAQKVMITRVAPTADPGVYKVTCTPVIRGRHAIDVKVVGIAVQRPSSALLIPFNPCNKHITPIRTICDLNHPLGVAVHDDGRIVVSEYGRNIVSVLSKEGKKVKSFGKGANNITFSYNHGVAITEDGYILVADAFYYRIQKISMDGSHIESVGKLGSGALGFNFPTGVAVSKFNDCIYIADSRNHRIQVLYPDLTFCRTFGKEGTGNGEFKNPQDVAIDGEGSVYVTDYYNHRIQKFDPDGTFLSQFGSEGSGFGQLKSPAGITADNAGLVYVTEYGNHRVSVFTSEGVFIRCFGEKGINNDQFSEPHVGITFDKNGFLYICDYGNNRIVVY